jgi:tetratricopeptide (TPR) repeat protein
MARVSNGKLQDALTDCQMAREYGGVNYRSLSLKADIYRQLNDPAARTKTLDELATTAPKSSSDYLIRGVASVKAGNYTSALLDFRTASTLNPRYAHAWNNQAHVLGEKLHETDQAIAAMDRAVDANPQNGELFMGRAVLHARAGHRGQAHADVEKSLLLTDQPITVYQAACAYALTSRTHPGDADRAVDLLRKAIRDGYRDLKTLHADTDLQPIRSRDDFRRLLDAVGSLTQ